MSKKNKNDGSELHDKGKKKRNEQISNRREGPYKESVIQKQSIKSFKIGEKHFIIRFFCFLI